MQLSENKDKNHFPTKFENDIDFRIHVILGHIIVANIFLEFCFVKYYAHFLEQKKFDKGKFLRIIGYIDILLDGENYTDRYVHFENIEPQIIQIIEGKTGVVISLKDSLLSDIYNILHTEGNSDDDFLPIYDLSIFDKPELINEVQSNIRFFVDEQMKELKGSINEWSLKNIKNHFIEKMKQILERVND